MKSNRSIAFFDAQFQKQVAQGDFALNPFELAALPFVRGSLLDIGCGIGNLAIEAARRGASVTAVDASEAAIRRIQAVALAEKLGIEAVLADAATFPIVRQFDSIVAIGLLMFFRRDQALQLLAAIQQQVATGGIAVINVLIAGTTYLDMFEPDSCCLLEGNELEQRFQGWDILLARRDSFDAPGNTKKEFATIVARKG